MDCVAHQSPLSLGFSRQEYCSGLPCPPTGALHDMTQGWNLRLTSPLLSGGCCTPSATWKPGDSNRCVQKQQRHSLMFQLARLNIRECSLSNLAGFKLAFFPLLWKLVSFEWGLPGRPLAKTSCSQCRGPGFDIWSGN